jgi:hypothetical protein
MVPINPTGFITIITHWQHICPFALMRCRPKPHDIINRPPAGPLIFDMRPLPDLNT